MGLDEVLAEIAGRPRFAWLPVRLYNGSGHFERGWAWLRWVTYKRAIGWPRYFHTAE